MFHRNGLFVSALLIVTLCAGILLGHRWGNQGDPDPAAVASLSEIAALQDELAAVRSRQQREDAFATAAREWLMNGSLEGVALGLVTLPDAPSPWVDDIRQSISQAGGNVVRAVSLTENFWDDNQAAYRASLSEQISIHVNDLAGESSTQVLAEALAQAVLYRSDPHPDLLLNEFEPVAQAQVLEEIFATAELADFDGAAIPDVVLVLGDVPKTVTGADQMQFALLKALDAAGAQVVWAFKNDPFTAADAPILPASVSTVVGADASTVDVIVVLAIREQFLGGSGNYGNPISGDYLPRP